MKPGPIKDKKKITTLFEKGRIINGENISIRVHRFKGEEQGYVISVPKKSFPLAVNRNLIKRRLRAGLANLSDNNHSLSFFLIYISKKIVATKKLKEEINSLIKKA
jgi:ribonuclease P protein component